MRDVRIVDGAVVTLAAPSTGATPSCDDGRGGCTQLRVKGACEHPAASPETSDQWNGRVAGEFRNAAEADRDKSGDVDLEFVQTAGFMQTRVFTDDELDTAARKMVDTLAAERRLDGAAGLLAEVRKRLWKLVSPHRAASPETPDGGELLARQFTFAELVEYGCERGGHIVNGMSWSFTLWNGAPVTHENDECYLVTDSVGTVLRFTPRDILVTGPKGQLVVLDRAKVEEMDVRVRRLVNRVTTEQEAAWEYERQVDALTAEKDALVTALRDAELAARYNADVAQQAIERAERAEAKLPDVEGRNARAEDYITRLERKVDELAARLASAQRGERDTAPKHEAEWHEDHGPVLWWMHPVAEPPYCGTPHDSDWPFHEDDKPRLWWTPIDGNRVHDAIAALSSASPEQEPTDAPR